MPQHTEVGRSATAFDADATLTVVVEMSRSTWLVAGLVPGVDRRPLKRLEPDEAGLLAQLGRWRQEAIRNQTTVIRGLGPTGSPTWSLPGGTGGSRERSRLRTRSGRK
jgi:transposase